MLEKSRTRRGPGPADIVILLGAVVNLVVVVLFAVLYLAGR
jgi:hypothetical protein